METESIDKTCTMCREEAHGTIKSSNGERSIELCKSCAKDVLWELIHNSYCFEED